jgi:hypothetical protein
MAREQKIGSPAIVIDLELQPEIKKYITKELQSVLKQSTLS